MIIWNAIIHEGSTDSFDLEEKVGFKNFKLDLSMKNEESKAFRTNIYDNLIKNRFDLNELNKDFLNLSLVVYNLDQLISRKTYGFQNWGRHIVIYMPVVQVDKWLKIKDDLEKMLSFISGDKWEFYFRNSSRLSSKQVKLLEGAIKTKIDKVALFSGGLDSFVASLDLLSKKENVCFVSHYKTGTDKSAQNTLYEELQKKYGENSFKYYQFYVQPNQKNKIASKENSSRARSFLFFTIGLIIASTFGEDVSLMIPENGLISLNVPLTGTRVGSHSTRTTHPFYLNLFQKIAKKMGYKNKLMNPYQFKTKGEMMLNCSDYNTLSELTKHTTSCSHPEQSRYSGLKPGTQCGYCVPCIIRQAAEKKSNISGTGYAHNILEKPPSPESKKGRDLRAFKIALERLEKKAPEALVFDVLSNGPIPYKKHKELLDYAEVYKRGMDEVKTLLDELA